MKVGERCYLIRQKDTAGRVYYRGKRNNQPFYSYDAAVNTARRLDSGEVVAVELRVLGTMQPVPDAVTNPVK